MTRARWARVASAGVLAAMVLGACGNSDSQFVTNSRAGVYLRIPDDWRVFNVQAGDPTSFKTWSVGSGTVPTVITPWRVAFDGSDDPSRSHFEEELPQSPIGMMEVYGFPEGPPPELATLVGLRSLISPAGEDPLMLEGTDGDFEVEEYQELELEGGHWGTLVSVSIESGDATVRLTQVAVFDKQLDRLHLLTVGCAIECYEQHETEFNGIVDSLTLEDR